MAGPSRWALIFAAAAVAVPSALAVLLWGLVSMATRSPGAPAEPATEAVPPPALPVPPPASPAPAVKVTPPPPVTVPRVAEEPAQAGTPPLLPPAFEGAPVVGRSARALGTVGRDLMNGLAALGPQLSACVEGTDRAGTGAVLVLLLEPEQGRVRIADAPVQSEGSLRPAALTCLQRVLRGQEIAARDSRHGQRLRMPYPINP